LERLSEQGMLNIHSFTTSCVS